MVSRKKPPRLGKLWSFAHWIFSVAVLIAHFTGYLHELSTAKVPTDVRARLVDMLSDPGGASILAVIREFAIGLFNAAIAALASNVGGVIILLWALAHSVVVGREGLAYLRHRFRARRRKARSEATEKAEPGLAERTKASTTPRAVAGQPAWLLVKPASTEPAYIDGGGI